MIQIGSPQGVFYDNTCIIDKEEFEEKLKEKIEKDYLINSYMTDINSVYRVLMACIKDKSSYSLYEKGVVVNIPECVETIGKNAFQGCWFIDTIIIPDSVTRIKNGAFRHCRNLKEIWIPKTVNTFGKSIFYNSGVSRMLCPMDISRLHRSDRNYLRRLGAKQNISLEFVLAEMDNAGVSLTEINKALKTYDIEVTKQNI